MAETYRVDAHIDVDVPMRDGVTLSADIYRPRASGRFPTVLIRTPYGNGEEPVVRNARALANSGYVCVLQDVRGRYDSGGDYYPFTNEPEDGFDTQEWIGRQDWSNGKIGMSGASYPALAQWYSAPLGSDYLTCMVPRVIAADMYDAFRPGGAFLLNTLITWGLRTAGHTAQSIDNDELVDVFHTLPLIDMDRLAGRRLAAWRDWMGHVTYDSYWHDQNVDGRWDEIAAPAFLMSGWYDLYSKQVFTDFNSMRRHARTSDARKSKVIVGPWPHHLSISTRTGEVDFGAASMVNLNAMETRWFDYWLKGIDNGIVDEPPVRIFVMGTNQWRDEHEWPLERTDWQRWHLHSDGSANTFLGGGALAPDPPGDEPSDHFVYDPRAPVQTIGGPNCCSPHLVPWGPYDQRPAEARHDVLCYSSEPLAADLEVTGPIRVVLYAASDAPDTDWTAKLVDVSPTGYAMNLCDSIVRARFRESRTDPTLLEPGRVYEYEINLTTTANVFRAAHRLRLEISSSNFPRFDRNLNTGGPLTTETEMRPARQTVLHDRAHPSHIVLPVIPAG